MIPSSPSSLTTKCPTTPPSPMPNSTSATIPVFLVGTIVLLLLISVASNSCSPRNRLILVSNQSNLFKCVCLIFQIQMWFCPQTRFTNVPPHAKHSICCPGPVAVLDPLFWNPDKWWIDGVGPLFQDDQGLHPGATTVGNLNFPIKTYAPLPSKHIGRMIKCGKCFPRHPPLPGTHPRWTH